MIIGVIGAMDIEVSHVIEQFEKSEKIVIGDYIFYKGVINSNTCIIVKGGIGKTNIAICTTILINYFKPQLIINTGIAGGVSPLRTSDVLLATSLSYHDADATVFGYELGQIPGCPKEFIVNQAYLIQVKKILSQLNIDYKTGRILTGDKFVTSKDQIQGFNLDGNVACEMEGASVAHVCHKFCIDFISIRYISDIIDSEEQLDNYKSFEFDMALMSSKICLAIIGLLHN